MLIASIVITSILLLIVAVTLLYKRKKKADLERIQEEELEFFLSFGAGGYSWKNVGQRHASALSDSVPVIHTQIGGSAQVPDQESQVPGETWISRYRFR